MLASIIQQFQKNKFRVINQVEIDGRWWVGKLSNQPCKTVNSRSMAIIRIWLARMRDETCLLEGGAAKGYIRLLDGWVSVIVSWRTGAAMLNSLVEFPRMTGLVWKGVRMDGIIVELVEPSSLLISGILFQLGRK